MGTAATLGLQAVQPKLTSYCEGKPQCPVEPKFKFLLKSGVFRCTCEDCIPPEREIFSVDPLC